MTTIRCVCPGCGRVLGVAAADAAGAVPCPGCATEPVPRAVPNAQTVYPPGGIVTGHTRGGEGLPVGPEGRLVQYRGRTTLGPPAGPRGPRKPRRGQPRSLRITPALGPWRCVPAGRSRPPDGGTRPVIGNGAGDANPAIPGGAPLRAPARVCRAREKPPRALVWRAGARMGWVRAHRRGRGLDPAASSGDRYYNH